MLTAVCVCPVISGKGCSSFGRGRVVSEDQIFAPMPTVHANWAERSRMETFLVRSETEARVERTVERAEVGLGKDLLMVRTRKVAWRVRGASTAWGETGR